MPPIYLQSLAPGAGFFDGYIIGLTATPSRQTLGFFKKNLVMEYGHEEAVADGVNVNYDVYRIRTEITEKGSKVESGYFVDVRNRETREIRWEHLDEDLEYDANRRLTFKFSRIFFLSF